MESDNGKLIGVARLGDVGRMVFCDGGRVMGSPCGIISGDVDAKVGCREGVHEGAVGRL